MPDLADLFPGYELRWIETSGGRIFARVSDGGGPPLLLLHGHPQSNVMWHRLHRPGLSACNAHSAGILSRRRYPKMGSGSGRKPFKRSLERATRDGTI